MAAYTPYKHLEKPISTEKYNIAVVNKNNDIIDSELHKLEMKNQSQDELLATKEALSKHITDKTNPHGLDKNDIGLNNVDNTSDLDKPVSFAQQNAISEAVTQSNLYTDIKITPLINDAPETLDTLKKIADAIEENEAIVEALDATIKNMVNQTDILKNIESINGNTTEGKLVDALVVKEVFQSVSNGKQLVASAITDKGVNTEATDTFEIMAENIGNIQLNGSGNGIISPVPYHLEFDGAFTKTKISHVTWYFPFENIRKIKLKEIIVTGRYYDSSNPTFDVIVTILLKRKNGASVMKTLKSIYISSTTLTRVVLDKEIDIDDESSSWYDEECDGITGIYIYGGTAYNTANSIYHVTCAGDIDIYL